MLDRESLELSVGALSHDEQRLLHTYMGEAQFFTQLLAPDFDWLTAGDCALEIGSGIGLLALQLAQLGKPIVAFEPQSAGFGQMLRMREMITQHWHAENSSVRWVDDFILAQDVRLTNLHPTYAYAVNVIEHVPDIEGFVSAVLSNLAPGGRFRFICPNYAYPYEPHFEIPTLFSKRATYRIMRSRITRSAITDSQRFWDELSWPTVMSLRRIFRRLGVRHEFALSATRAYLDRSRQDSTFRDRKGAGAQRLFQVAAHALPHVAKRLPPFAYPVIDCTLYN